MIGAGRRGVLMAATGRHAHVVVSRGFHLFSSAIHCRINQLLKRVHMKAHYKSPSGNMTFEVEGAGIKEIFEDIAEIQEIFGVSRCGACGSMDTKFRVREVDGNKYYEQVCQNGGDAHGNGACRARLSFGQNRDMKRLYPKRKDKDGNYIANGGWEKYVKTSTGN